MKLTILNRNKEYVTSLDGEGQEEYLRLTKIEKTSGKFYVSVPDHLHNIASIVCKDFYTKPAFKGDKPSKLSDLPYLDGYVYADKRDDAQDMWKRLIWRCREFLMDKKREKVLVLHTEMNVCIMKDGKCVLSRSDVSFAKTNPLVGFRFDVCYRVGDNLVNDNNQWKGDADKNVVIAHTDEREAFLKSIVDKLENAAIQLDQFHTMLMSDPLKIEEIMKSGFMITHDQAQT